MNNLKGGGFLLSKELEDLPFIELKSILEVYGVYKLNRYSNYVISNEVDVKTIKDTVKRGGYINEGHLIVYDLNRQNNFSTDFNTFCREITNIDRDFFQSIIYTINSINNDIKNNKNNNKSNNKNNNLSFAVRTVKIDDDIPLSTMEIERKIGHIIKSITKYPVNLKNPNIAIKIIILKEKIIMSILIEKRDREYFQKNRPHLRTYFHPGCILPKLGRCMVNLGHLKENDMLYDPFCGTGGFLIEGGFIGCRLIGSDISEEMVKGTLLNLKSYNLLDKVISVKKWDANKFKDYLNSLNIDKVDAIITDPPYGISTSAKGNIINILEHLNEGIKKNGYFVFASPSKVILKNENMYLEGIYSIYVHKSLTRYIHIYKIIN